uniref:Uncharacterized protein n=1 Tax=Glossina palpalis gambiensis TaxID=67801 RepID=A0A1B0BUG3_9MUSC
MHEEKKNKKFWGKFLKDTASPSMDPLNCAEFYLYSITWLNGMYHIAVAVIAVVVFQFIETTCLQGDQLTQLKAGFFKKNKEIGRKE